MSLKYLRSNYFTAYGFWHWGEGFQTVLFTWYMTFHAQLSPAEIGFYQALVLSPFLVFTIAGGVLTDRFGAGRCYFISTCLFAAVLVAYGIVDNAQGYVPALFFGYCVLAGLVSAVSNPSIDTFIPEATPLGAQANGLLAASVHNVAKLTGTLTGLLLPVLMATGGFVFNGALMLASAVFLRRYVSQLPAQTPQALQAHAPLRSLRKHYRDCPENLDIALSSVLLGLLIVPAGYILVPLVIRERFPEYGDMFALVNISSWVGAIVATSLAQRLSVHIKRPGLGALLAWFGYGLGLLMLLVVGSFWHLCFMVMALGVVKLGKALIYGKYLHNSPLGARGILVAVDQTAFWGLATLGTFGLGQIVQHMGLEVAIVGTSAAILICVSLLALRGHLLKMRPA